MGLMFTSCNEQNLKTPNNQYSEIHTNPTENDEYDKNNEADSNATEPTTPYTLVETDEGVQRIFPPSTLTIEHFLEDIDYLMYVLENNFALLEVAYTAWGVDAWALADSARDAVLAAYEYGNLCEDRYLAIVWAHFFPLFNTGHFVIFNPMAYYGLINNYRIWGIERYPAIGLNYRLLHTPLALRFYEERVNDRLQDIDIYRPIIQEVIQGMEDVHNRTIRGSLHTFMNYT